MSHETVQKSLSTLGLDRARGEVSEEGGHKPRFFRKTVTDDEGNDKEILLEEVLAKPDEGRRFVAPDEQEFDKGPHSDAFMDEFYREFIEKSEEKWGFSTLDFVEPAAHTTRAIFDKVLRELGPAKALRPVEEGETVPPYLQVDLQFADPKNPSKFEHHDHIFTAMVAWGEKEAVVDTVIVNGEEIEVTPEEDEGVGAETDSSQEDDSQEGGMNAEDLEVLKNINPVAWAINAHIDREREAKGEIVGSKIVGKLAFREDVVEDLFEVIKEEFPIDENLEVPEPTKLSERKRFLVRGLTQEQVDWTAQALEVPPNIEVTPREGDKEDWVWGYLWETSEAASWHYVGDGEFTLQGTERPDDILEEYAEVFDPTNIFTTDIMILIESDVDPLECGYTQEQVDKAKEMAKKNEWR